MILQTMNERLMRKSAAGPEAILAQFKTDLEDMAHRWSEDARSKAERIINASLEASANQMNKNAQAAAKAVTDAINAELPAVQKKLNNATSKSRQVAMLNLVAAGLVLVAAVIAAFAL
jgi:Flp pilus assembly protein TadB